MTSAFALLVINLLLIIALHPKPCQAARPVPAANSNGSVLFVRNACSSTIYPDLCFGSLSSYASSIKSSPMLLAHAALSISLEDARSVSTAMRSNMLTTGGRMSPRESGAMRDCMENVGSSIDQLRDSLGEMGNLRGKDIGYQINNIQTWVSAALTNDNSCMDGFDGKAMDGKLKTAVRSRVLNVAHLTSNALALIVSFAASSDHHSAAEP